MHKLLVLFYFILSLAGCDHAGRTIVMRNTANGIDVIYSRVTVTGPIANFECIHSHSRQCYYALFEHDCSSQPSCAPTPFKQFAMAVDTEQHITDLPQGFQLCASAEAKAMTRECLHPDATTKASVASVSD